MTPDTPQAAPATAARPLPVPTSATQAFWDATLRNELVIQQCNKCGKRQFYPRAFCRHCLSDDFEWISCSGRGEIYTFTINHRAANGHMAGDLPYAVAMVSLEEGVRLMSNIVNTPMDAIRIGAPVRLCWLQVNDRLKLPQFALDIRPNGVPDNPSMPNISIHHGNA